MVSYCVDLMESRLSHDVMMAIVFIIVQVMFEFICVSRTNWTNIRIAVSRCGGLLRTILHGLHNSSRLLKARLQKSVRHCHFTRSSVDAEASGTRPWHCELHQYTSSLSACQKTDAASYTVALKIAPVTLAMNNTRIAREMSTDREDARG